MMWTYHQKQFALHSVRSVMGQHTKPVNPIISITNPQTTQSQQDNKHSLNPCLWPHIHATENDIATWNVTTLLPKYIIIATLNNTNGVILAVAHSAAAALLKNSDLLKCIIHLPSLHSSHWNNWVESFLPDSLCPGAVSEKRTCRTRTVADQPAPHSTWRRHFYFPSRKMRSAQVEKSQRQTLSKPCPAVRVLPFGVREEKTTTVLLSRGCCGNKSQHYVCSSRATSSDSAHPAATGLAV